MMLEINVPLSENEYQSVECAFTSLLGILCVAVCYVCVSCWKLLVGLTFCSSVL